jgi:hypothetical protein
VVVQSLNGRSLECSSNKDSRDKVFWARFDEMRLLVDDEIVLSAFKLQV